MKGFRFRLDPVLELRRRQLELRRNELERERAAADAADAAAESAEQRSCEAARGVDARLESKASPAELRAMRSGLDRLRQAARRAGEGRARWTRRVEAAREATLEAWRGTQVLERLRTRAEDDHRREAQKDEQKEIDEMARRSAGRGDAT